MTRAKKRTKTSTPRRKSTRKRTRTAKGIYYDEHLQEFIDPSGKPKDPEESEVNDEQDEQRLQGAGDCDTGVGETATLAGKPVSEAATPDDKPPDVCETATPIILVEDDNGPFNEDQPGKSAAIRGSKIRSFSR